MDHFFEQMFTAARDHTHQVNRVLYSPLLAEARNDPRFPQLLALQTVQIRPR